MDYNRCSTLKLHCFLFLKVYRMCTARGGGQAFLCPEATRFNQRTLVCDHAFRVKCSDSSSFFHRNLIIHEESMKATKQAKLRNKGIVFIDAVSKNVLNN